MMILSHICTSYIWTGVIWVTNTFLQQFGANEEIFFQEIKGWFQSAFKSLLLLFSWWIPKEFIELVNWSVTKCRLKMWFLLLTEVRCWVSKNVGGFRGKLEAIERNRVAHRRFGLRRHILVKNCSKPAHQLRCLLHTYLPLLDANGTGHFG